MKTTDGVRPGPETGRGAVSRESDLEWEELKAKLLAYREAQRRDWGDVTDELLARYLTGGCTAAERARVEAARQKYPKVREALQLVAEVLPLTTGKPAVPPP